MTDNKDKAKKIKFDKCLVIESTPINWPKSPVLANNNNFRPRLVLLSMEMYERERHNLFTAIAGGGFIPVEDHYDELVNGDIMYDDIHELEEQNSYGSLFKDSQGQWQKSRYSYCGIYHVWANTEMINNLIQRLPVKAISSHVYTAYRTEVFHQLPLFK